MSRQTFHVNDVEWAVFDVIPEWTSNVDPALRYGWLCFDSDLEQRRLGPIPPNWERCTHEEFAQLLRAATRIRDPWRRLVE